MSNLPVFVAALAGVSLAGPAVAAAAAPGTPGPVALQGTVMDRRSAWEGGLIVTRTRLRVERMISGTAPAVVEVRELGGRVGDIAQVAYGQPRMPQQSDVTVELAPVGATWHLAAVLQQVASPDPAASAGAGGPSAAAGGLLMAGNYVRTTTKDSTPPCDGPQRNVFWPVTAVHYVLDSACAPGVPVDACEAAVMASFQTWTDVDCAYLSFAYDGRIDDAPIGFDRTSSNVNAVKWILTDWPAQPEALAITLGSIGCSTGRIMDADILINATHASFTIDDPPPVDGTDIQNTLTHEAGHMAGFAHSPDPLSTMFATADPGETEKRDLTADDAAGLCDVYPVGNEPGTGGGCGCITAGDPAPPGAVVLAALALLATPRRRRRPST